MVSSAQNVRTYGGRPYSVAVLHGGPGAPGEMAPVARRLSSHAGILEPLQTGRTIEEQLTGLKNSIEMYMDAAGVLIGFSWGAMLGFIFTARYPEMVNKLILVSSGSFEACYAEGVMKIRLSRLNNCDKKQVISLLSMLDNPLFEDKNALFSQLGMLLAKADCYDALPHNNEILTYQYDIFKSVWGEASTLRVTGQLIELGEHIRCPVIAIHGDYDPHPAIGVVKPLSRVLMDFKYICLEKCGHYPWWERNARGEFYRILTDELSMR